MGRFSDLVVSTEGLARSASDVLYCGAKRETGDLTLDSLEGDSRSSGSATSVITASGRDDGGGTECGWFSSLELGLGLAE